MLLDWGLCIKACRGSKKSDSKGDRAVRAHSPPAPPNSSKLTLDGGRHVIGLAQVADALVDAREAARPDVEDAHRRVAPRVEQLLHDVAAEEAGAADDERGAELAARHLSFCWFVLLLGCC